MNQQTFFQNPDDLKKLYLLRIFHVYLKGWGIYYRTILMKIKEEKPISSPLTIVKLFYETMYEHKKKCLHKYIDYPVNCVNIEIEQVTNDIVTLYNKIIKM